MFYIKPTSYHAVQTPHFENFSLSVPSYWVSYPLFEHTSLFVSTSVGYSVLQAGNDSFSVSIPTYLIVTFDLIVTKVIRFVRAAKAGRFFPYLHFFHDMTSGFTSMSRIRDIIICMKHIMRRVPALTGLVRNLILILYCAAIPQELTISPWSPTRDVGRESILRSIADMHPPPNQEVDFIVQSSVESLEYQALLNAPSYTNLILNSLRSEYAQYTENALSQ